jgi:hypothetical protein
VFRSYVRIRATAAIRKELPHILAAVDDTERHEPSKTALISDRDGLSVLREERIDGVHCIALHARDDVAVRVESDGDRRVTQTFAHDLEMDTGTEHQRG